MKRIPLSSLLKIVFSLKTTRAFLFLSLTFSIFFLTFQTCPLEKSNESIFLENVMIRCGGLYVLMGSKPMIDFHIDSGYPETEEECRRDYVDEYLRRLKEENRESSAMSYEQYSAMCTGSKHKHTQRLWDDWEKRMNNYVGPCYRFIALKSLRFLSSLNTKAI